MSDFGDLLSARARVNASGIDLPQRKGVTIMGGKFDVVKGRIKEAAGALTDNEQLREEGQTDQAIGKARQAADEKLREDGKTESTATKVEHAIQQAADVTKKAVKKVTGN